MSCLSQSHTQLTPAKQDSAALSSSFWCAGIWSCPSSSAWAWLFTSWDTFRLLKWQKKYSLYSLVPSVHPVSWISSPQSQMSMRPRKDEAAGMQTWRGDHTNPFSSCKLLDWVSIFVRVTPLGPSILLLPTWLKPQVRTKLKGWKMGNQRETKAEFPCAFLCKMERRTWHLAILWLEASTFDDLMNYALSVHQ